MGTGIILGAAVALFGLSMVSAASGQAFLDDEGLKNKVTLQLQLSGLGKQGCVIEIKPAHPACSFKPMKFKVGGMAADRAVTLDPIVFDASSTGADRDCSFAITLREPGQNPRTFQRGLRLSEPMPEQDTPEKTLKCYLSASSVANRSETSAQRR